MLGGDKLKHIIFLVIFIGMLITGCAGGEETPTSSPVLVTPVDLVSALTPTPLPLAAKVNNSDILLSDFEEEVQRCQAALQATGADNKIQDFRKIVLDDLIDQTLLADAALQNGYQLTDENLQNRIDGESNSLGDSKVLQDWMDKNYYTQASFTRMYRLSLLSTWQRNAIFESVPEKAEQIHARQIFSKGENDARSYHQQLSAGADFLILAEEVDPITRGDLGWFPRGYLFQPEVEDAAYKLQPGEYSDVIKSQVGYHIIQVVEKEMNRDLDPEQRISLQKAALESWIKDQREKSSIKIFIE